MPIIAVEPPAQNAGPTGFLPCRVSEGNFEVVVNGGVVEVAVKLGAGVAEVMFVAEFVAGDAGFEVALGERGGEGDGEVDALVREVLDSGGGDGISMVGV